MIRHLPVLLLTVSFACESFAQGFPSDAAISAEMKAVAAQRQSVFGGGASVPTPPMPQPLPATIPAPTFPAVPTPSPAGMDVERLANEYRQKFVPPAVGGGYEVAIFISLGMPADSIRRYADHASRIGGVLILRGFKDNSLRATTEAVQSLSLGQANVQINPAAFSKYKISAVPSIVLTKTEAATRIDGEGCALPDTYAAISGDVSLAYALEQIGDRVPDFQRPVQRYLLKLREGS